LKLITVQFNTGQKYECSVFTNNYPWTNIESIGIGSDGSVTASGPNPRCARI
jgi:hypothetical protein